MTDHQFKDFLKKLQTHFDAQEERIVRRVDENMRSQLTDIRGNIDWIMGALDTDENERLALGSNFDRKHTDHERRITKLELATTN